MAAPKKVIKDPDCGTARKLYEALWWVVRSAHMRGPAGTKAYFISDENMAKAKAAVAEAEKA
jgi:hypothetical protein